MKLRCLSARRIGAPMFSLYTFWPVTSPSMWKTRADDGCVDHAWDDELGSA